MHARRNGEHRRQIALLHIAPDHGHVAHDGVFPCHVLILFIYFAVRICYAVNAISCRWQLISDDTNGSVSSCTWPKQRQDAGELSTHGFDFFRAQRDFNLFGDLGMAFVEMAVELVARTTDREALFIEQFANTADQQDFVMLIIATVAAPLDRFELGEFLLPVAQHVRLHATQLADFTDGEIAFGGNRRQHNHRRFIDAFVHGMGLRYTTRARGWLLESSTISLSF